MENDSLQRYNELSDEQLAGLSCRGDEEAAATLIVRFLPLVRSRAGVYAVGNESFEDLCQEGTIGLLAAIRGFDEEKASFATFARVCIDRVLVSFSRSNNRKKRIPDGKLVSLDLEDRENLADLLAGSPDEDPESIVIGREEYLRLVHRVAKTLSPLENRVLSLYVGGAGYSEIAERLNLSTKAVDNALQRIRRKMK